MRYQLHFFVPAATLVIAAVQAYTPTSPAPTLVKRIGSPPEGYEWGPPMHIAAHLAVDNRKPKGNVLHRMRNVAAKVVGAKPSMTSRQKNYALSDPARSHYTESGERMYLHDSGKWRSIDEHH